ncbi:hypothetical protein CBS101457_002091 [Exobasidium rhododendri]|nr:hypothetical protein CBS101457_002091 [Exobasidium rhododendri]
MLLRNTSAHAIDLLICISISSPSAFILVETLKGEEVVRTLMERHTFCNELEKKGGSKRQFTLNEVQESPLAIKCAEFLLFFEYGTEERKLGTRGEQVGDGVGDASALLSDSFRSAVSQTYRHRPRKALETQARVEMRDGRQQSPFSVKLKSERAVFVSPKQEKIKAIRSRPIQTSFTKAELQRSLPSVRTPVNLAPTKSAPVSKESQRTVKTALTPFARSACTSPRKQGERGRSRDRNPFNVIQPASANSSRDSAVISSTHSSPLKSIIGPSPAVRRAQARSVSPVKMKDLRAAV